MMTPDEVEQRSKALEELKRLASQRKQMGELSSAALYFNGYNMRDAYAVEVATIRDAMVKHYDVLLFLQATLLRQLNVDPSSFLPTGTK